MVCRRFSFLPASLIGAGGKLPLVDQAGGGKPSVFGFQARKVSGELSLPKVKMAVAIQRLWRCAKALGRP